MREGRTHDNFLCIDDDLHRCRIALSVLRGFHVEVDLKARHPLQREWTVDEEKLLLSLVEQQEHELLPCYKLARKENPRLFPKFGTTEATLREHVQRLRADPALAVRLRLLEKALHLPDAPAAPALPVSDTAPDLRRMMSRLPRNVVLRLIARDGRAAFVEGNSQALALRSPYLAQLLSTAMPGKDEKKTIQLSEKDPAFAGCPDLFGVFEADNVAQYVNIVENPQLWTNKEKMQEQLTNLQRQQAEVWHSYQDRMAGDRERHLDALRDLQRQEEQALTSELQRCFDEDVRQLTYLHRSHIHLEVEKIQRRYQAVMDDVLHFYDSEQTKLTELTLRFDEVERLVLEQQLADLDQHIRGLLPDKALPRLLLLAEALRDGELRALCMQRIASRFTRFSKCPELGCELLRSTTVQELFSLCNMDQLVTVLDSEGYAFKAELLRKEVGYRQAQLAETYRQWPLQRLIDAQMAETEPFPALLEAELDSRVDRCAAALVTIDLQKLNPSCVQIDSDRRVATLVKAQRYATVVGTLGRQSGGWGKWYWECKVVQFERSNGCTVSVGWDVPRPNYQDSWIPGLQEGLGGFGIMWTSDGLLHHDGVSEDTYTTFDREDVVGIGMDQDGRTVSFYKNGEPVPLPRRQPALPLPAPYTLLPSVCLYAARAKPPLRVALDFGGPFASGPPRFFRPYAATNPSACRPEERQPRHRPGPAPRRG